ncbi:UbiD family decarboxylase [Chloroflexota bacterium]
MAYNDLREWIALLEKEGELARIKAKVNWDLEIGGIAQKIFDTEGPAVLFENIKDHENTNGKKFFTASLSTYPRIALALGLTKDTHPREIINTYMERVKKPVKPVMAKSAPVKENIFFGDDVDLLQLPVPRWHHHDGGRFIGTFDGVVTKDPETGWTNIGLYRREAHDRNHTGLVIVQGSHIWRHWRSHRKLGKKTMPIAVVNGWDPVLPMTACSAQSVGVCEYDIMGALRQKPVELVKCETIDLEVPASAEIVYEGEISLDIGDFKPEGPFGEYTGYYSRGRDPKPVINVKCLTHRNDPILQGTMEGIPVNEDHRVESINHSALIWNKLNEYIVGVTGVNAHPSTTWANLFIQIDNSYVGQVFQVACAVWGMELSNYVGKNIIVVDKDIDIFDLNKIMWAIAYRVDPNKDIKTFPGRLGAADITEPISENRIGTGIYLGTHMLIDATKKWFGLPRADEFFGEKFPPVAYPDAETMKLVESRWKEYGLK